MLSTPFKSNYALGWNIEKNKKSYSWYHWGTCNGYQSYFARHIETGHCIIIFCNQDFRFRDLLTEQIIKEIESIIMLGK